MRAAGYEVFSAADGMSCIVKAQRSRPDLVILDLGLPAGDGFTAIQRLRGNSHLSHIPILVLSARNATQWKSKAIEEGANDYLQKPVTKYSLLTTVQTLLGTEPAAAMPAASQQCCPHCGGSLSGMKLTFDAATIAAIASAVQGGRVE